jgi:hypothetical protein
MREKYKEGINRSQQQFFPPSLDEYVDENNQILKEPKSKLLFS